MSELIPQTPQLAPEADQRLEHQEGIEATFPGAVETSTVEPDVNDLSWVEASETEPSNFLDRVSRLAEKVQLAPYAVMARTVTTAGDLKEALVQRLPKLTEVGGETKAQRAWEHVRQHPKAVLGVGVVAVAGAFVAHAAAKRGVHTRGTIDTSNFDLMSGSSPAKSGAHEGLLQPRGGGHSASTLLTPDQTGTPKGQMTETLHGPIHRQWVDSNSQGLDFKTLKNGDVKVTFDGQGLPGKPDLQVMMSDPKGDKALIHLTRGKDGNYSQVVSGDTVFGHALHGNDQQYAEVVSKGKTSDGTTHLTVYSTQEGSGSANIPDKPAPYASGSGTEGSVGSGGPRPRQGGDTPTIPTPEKPSSAPTPTEAPSASVSPSPSHTAEATPSKSPEAEVTVPPVADHTETGNNGYPAPLEALAGGIGGVIGNTTAGTFINARRRQKLMGNKYLDNLKAGLITTATVPRNAVALAAGAFTGGAAGAIVDGLNGLRAATYTGLGTGVATSLLRRVHLGRPAPTQDFMESISSTASDPRLYKEAIVQEGAALKQNVVGVRLDRQDFLRTGRFVLPPNEIIKRAENLVKLDDLAFTAMMYSLRRKEVPVVDRLLQRAAQHSGDEGFKESIRKKHDTLYSIWVDGDLYRGEPVTPSPPPASAPLPPAASPAPRPYYGPDEPAPSPELAPEPAAPYRQDPSNTWPPTPEPSHDDAQPEPEPALAPTPVGWTDERVVPPLPRPGNIPGARSTGPGAPSAAPHSAGPEALVPPQEPEPAPASEPEPSGDDRLQQIIGNIASEAQHQAEPEPSASQPVPMPSLFDSAPFDAAGPTPDDPAPAPQPAPAPEVAEPTPADQVTPDDPSPAQPERRTALGLTEDADNLVYLTRKVTGRKTLADLIEGAEQHLERLKSDDLEVASRAPVDAKIFINKFVQTLGTFVAFNMQPDKIDHDKFEQFLMDLGVREYLDEHDEVKEEHLKDALAAIASKKKR